MFHNSVLKVNDRKIIKSLIIVDKILSIASHYNNLMSYVVCKMDIEVLLNLKIYDYYSHDKMPTEIRWNVHTPN